MKFDVCLKSKSKTLFALKARQILFQFVFAAAFWFALPKQQSVNNLKVKCGVSLMRCFVNKAAQVSCGFIQSPRDAEPYILCTVSLACVQPSAPLKKNR